MTLWLKVRRAWICIITVLVTVLLIDLSKHLYLAIPNLLGGDMLKMPMPLILGIAICIVLGWGLGSGNPPLEAVASRPTQLLDTTYTLAITLLSLILCIILHSISKADVILAAGRNVLGYAGIMLLGRSFLGSNAATVLPTGFAIIVAMLGQDQYGRIYDWAWPLAGSEYKLSWVLAAILLIVGITCYLGRMTILNNSAWGNEN